MKKSLMALAAVAACGAAVGATTFEELQAEIAAADDGATVYVENDMDYTGLLTLGKTITLASPDGETNVLRRASSYASGMLVRIPSGETSDLTFKNLVIDGNKSVSQASASLMSVSDGQVTLAEGALVRDYINGSGPGTIAIYGKGKFYLNEGSAVRNCENYSYGSAFRIGATGNETKDGFLQIDGGEITGCADHHGAASREWGGAVYLYGGKFNFYGGKITGNTSDLCVGGVVVYSGEMQVKGAADLCGNTGGTVNDVALCSTSTSWNGYNQMKFVGEYSGHMTVCLFDGFTNEGDASYRIWVDQDRNYYGVANVTLQGTDLCLNGFDLKEHYYPKWTKPVARTTGYNIVAFNRLKLAPTDTLTLLQDCEYTGYLSVTGGKDLTITSGEGGPYRLSPTRSGIYPFWVEKSTLRLRDVVVDGRADEGISIYSEDNTFWTSFVLVGTNGTVVLEKGTVLKNAKNRNFATGVNLYEVGATLVMEEGSTICGMETTGYASAVRVGQSNSYVENPPRFIMRGGVISNCVCTASGGNATMGGAVFVWGGALELKGGLITENACDNDGPSGVNVYTGLIDVTGTARVLGNFGAHPDVYVNGMVREAEAATMSGSFRGRVGVSSATPDADQRTGFKSAEGASGAWNFFAPVGDTVGLVGYAWKDNNVIYFGKPTAWIDGVGYNAQYEMAARALLPTTIDLDALSDDLPHTLKGSARSLGGSIAVSVDDEAAWRAEHGDLLPLKILEGVDGEVTGQWTFALPECAGTGHWKVRRRRTETGSAYFLDWTDAGLLFIVR